ncbi:TolB family protein [Cellulomonas sp. ICMP 17802]|uniref:TolB family protein n=1 Tax=Cellulomonas sp. ICMP 17802 TaxID=3239199 RepID=UPI00351B2947
MDARLRRPALAGLVALVAGGALGVSTPAAATPPHHHDPDGLIVFSAATAAGDRQLFTLRPDGTDLTQITHGAGDPTNADWSADGRHLVFSLDDGTSTRTAIVRPDGSDLRVLPQPPGVTDNQPSFSPDGRRIYFEREDLTTHDDAIWSMKADGTDQRRVVGPFPDGFVTDPNISPDGRTLIFQGWDGTVLGPPPNLEPARGLFMYDLRSGRTTQIRPFTADETIKASWAPDGRRIAVTENANHYVADDSANIVTVRPDGSGVRQVTAFHDPEVNAFLGSYSPDGRWLVFRMEDHGLFGLYRVRPDGSHTEVILPLSTFRPALIDWGVDAGRDGHGDH